MSAPGGTPDDLLRHGRAAIVVCDPAGRVLVLTAHAAELLGGACRAGLAGVAEDAGAVLAFLADLAARDPATEATCVVTTRGEPRRVLDVVGVNRLAEPAVGGLVLTLADVTAYHERLAELEARATTDPVTGLPNRIVFEETLRHVAGGAQPACVAMIDLDDFRAVNDRHGHGVGDVVLAEVGRRIAALLPGAAEAMAARLGGEEFGVLLPGLLPADAAPRVEGMLAALRHPHAVAGVVTASAGLAPVVADGGLSRTQAAMGAWRSADAAMYAAKAAGRDRLVVHDPASMDGRGPLGQRLDALERARAAAEAEARTDSLTGVPNRRRLDEDLPALDARTRAEGGGYAVVFVDLDRFGLVNKVWDQAAGDHTLREAAAALGSALRASDVLYRHGGEEFVALLADAGTADALGVADRMREALAARALPHPTGGSVTASVGVARFDPSRHPDGPAVVAAADAAMRRAKSAGRDRVVSDPE